MKAKNPIDPIVLLLDLVLPDGILDWFGIIKVEGTALSKPDPIMEGEVHIYLDERDNRSEEMQDLKPNGFTESKEVTDFPLSYFQMVVQR